VAGWGGGMRGGGFGRVVAATVIVTTAIIGVNLSTGGAAPVEANVFTVASGGSTSCARSASLLTYAEAVAAGGGAICGSGSGQTSWDRACAAATGGDIVGVMPGVYGRANTWLLGNVSNDCSDGSGADYDPNYAEKGDSPASLSNWVSFVAGEDCGGDPNVTFSDHVNINDNRHVIVEGECFDFNRTMYMIDGGSASLRPENIIIRGSSRTAKAQMYGIEIRGGRNIWFQNIDYGPNVQCAANDTNATPTYFRCDPAGAYFESFYATAGTNAAGCTPNATGLCAGFFGGGSPTGANEFVEPFIHGGAGGNLYEDIRFENFNVHDGQAKGTGSGVHPGCFMFDGIFGQSGLPAHNMVFDSVSCERQVIGIQHQDAGVTVQNSYFGCPVVDLPQTSPVGEWDDCAASQASVGLACRADETDPDCVNSNVLYRYNVFFQTNSAAGWLAQTPSATFGTYSNVRVIGNIFINSTLQGCSITGVSCANNSFYNVATAGSSATTLSCDPTVDSDMTNGGTWSETTELDPRLNGSSCGVPTLDPSSLGADYQLGFDIDGAARGASATKAGADNG
jgi:hypothetical protein